ncbi:redox-sensing transcriptional repressor Rex [candidate division KSB1 bacterium]
MRKESKIKTRRISGSTIRRLSMYHRTLDILDHGGVETISSQKLADIEDITSAQVRKDLSFFGSFGRRGLGYNVSLLKKSIAHILGLNKRWNIVLIGAGHLGNALMNYEEFKKKNFYITKIFDKSRKMVGKEIKDIPINHINDLEEMLDAKTDNLAILAIPPQDVQSIIDRLSKIGIRGVLYFASRTVSVPKNMVIRNEDTSIELETLTYHITNKTDRPVKAFS